ncbi:MAG TPA: hypothetical protein VN033_14545 [Vulgatibacter sp.]|nr:hypothetical protein [Vulgatibacter sp.]
MRYQVRSKGGKELNVADGKQLVRLLNQRLLDLDDEVRRKGEERWRRIGDIPEYAQMIHAEKQDIARFRAIFLVTLLLASLAAIVAVLSRL